MTDTNINEFRRLAAKIDQYKQQLAAKDVSEAHAITNREIKRISTFSIYL